MYVAFLLFVLFTCFYEPNIAKPTHENAFDKIARIDSKFKESTDHRYEVDMILPSGAVTRRKRNTARGFSNYKASLSVQLWNNGVIPFTISGLLASKPGLVNTLLDAMEEWQTKTCVQFKKRTNERDYVHFYQGQGCLSDVGVKRQGRQTLSLGRDCDDRKILIHELGHTIGLYHEQNRPDRDRYIQVLKDNIIPAFQYAYRIKDGWHPDSIRTPYDYYSVMHYGNKDFNIGDRVTMRSYKKSVTYFGGVQVSGLDARRVRKMYKCKEYPVFPFHFYWNYGNYGTNGRTCIDITVPEDATNGWDNNKLCYFSHNKRPLNIKWSNKGPIPGMACTKISYSLKSTSPGWKDNYICISKYGPYKFRWVNGRVDRKERSNCLRIREPSDRNWSKDSHYLCAYQREMDPIDGKWSEWNQWGECTRPCGGGSQVRQRTCSPTANGGKNCEGENAQSRVCNLNPCNALPSFPEDFKYEHTQPFTLPASGICLRTYDLLEYWLWSDYYFCSSEGKSNPHIEWSFMGAIPGMRCTRIYNPYERSGWTSNFLCVPKTSPYRFKWSINGPIPGMTCMRWYAQNGRRGWDKTYLCDDKRKPPIKAFH